MNYETSINGGKSGQESSEQDMAGFDQENDPNGGRRKIWLILLVLAVLVGGGAYYFYNKSQSDAASAKAAADSDKQGQSVSVIAASSQTIVRIINASGTIAARRDTQVGAVGEGGRVLQVYAEAGDWVKQGQVLVSIDRSVQMQQAGALQAQIGVAQADLQLAENELGRALQLVGRGFISKADVDRKTAARKSARTRVTVAQAQLNETRARNARLDIVAPVGGYVLERNVEPGQTVGAGTGMLFRIAKGGELELQALLSEDDLATVSTGVVATVTPVGDTRQFTGRIWQIAPTINAQTRQGIARIALPFDRALRPGGFASAQIAAGATTAAILPESAVLHDEKGNYVYLVDSANKAVRRDIKTGSVTSTGVPILEGLNGTERVVAYAGSFLSQGESVIPKLLKAK
jgi:HlyD family secretion protein